MLFCITNFKKVLDKAMQICYNIDTVKETNLRTMEGRLLNMKFTVSYIPYFDLISNMKKYEVDVFNYVRKMIEAYDLGNYRLAHTYESECHGYITCLFYNDIIDSDTFDTLSKYLSHSLYA